MMGDQADYENELQEEALGARPDECPRCGLPYYRNQLHCICENGPEYGLNTQGSWSNNSDAKRGE